MRHLKQLLISFAASWGISIIGLLCVGIVTDLGRDPGYYTATPIEDIFRALFLFAFTSFICLSPAWLVIVPPYYFFIRRKSETRHPLWHAIGAGGIGMVYMVIMTEVLPVENDSWRFTAPIAFLAGFLGVYLFRKDPLKLQKECP